MPEQYHKLYRSKNHRVVAGVCGGIAEYFETDPALIRVIFAFLSLIGAGGLLLYIILWAVIPENPMQNEEHEHAEKKHSAFVHEVADNIRRSHRHAHGTFGFIIILIGVLLLVNNLFPELGFHKYWPIFIILFGAAIMFRHNS
jgi:phage shock protein C